MWICNWYIYFTNTIFLLSERIYGPTSTKDHLSATATFYRPGGPFKHSLLL